MSRLSRLRGPRSPLSRLRRLRGERGLTIPLVAMLIPVFMGLSALVIDIGNASQFRRQAQNAADAAAMAGAKDLPDAPTARTRARDYAAANLNVSPASLGTTACPAPSTGVCYETGDGRVRVEVTTPYQGNPLAMQVRVCRTVDTTFGRVLGRDTLTPCADASGRLIEGTAVGGPALLALSRSGGGGMFDVSSGSHVVITNGGIHVNATNDQALKATSGVSITTLDGSPINVSGGCAPKCDSYPSTPKPTPGQPEYPDPYLHLPPPTPPNGGLSSGSGTDMCNPGNPNRVTGNRQFTGGTITPSCFTGSVTFKDGHTVLEPGIYVFRDSITFDNATVTGNGVLLYKDSGGKKITITTNSDVSLVPQSTGTWRGIVYFQARSDDGEVNVTGSNAKVDLNEGLWYMPGSGSNGNDKPAFKADGTNFSWGGGAVIALSFKLSGGGTMGGSLPCATGSCGSGTHEGLELFE